MQPPKSDASQVRSNDILNGSSPLLRYARLISNPNRTLVRRKAPSLPTAIAEQEPENPGQQVNLSDMKHLLMSYPCTNRTWGREIFWTSNVSTIKVLRGLRFKPHPRPVRRRIHSEHGYLNHHIRTYILAFRKFGTDRLPLVLGSNRDERATQSFNDQNGDWL
jgi:hypothetical protein